MVVRERNVWFAAVVIALLCILPYLNGLRGEYVSDDHSLVANHPAVRAPFSLREALTAEYWPEHETARLWRPATTLSFALDRVVSSGAVWFHHAVNVVLHTLVTCLWGIFVWRLTRDGTLAGIVAALFAVHPIHTEAVTWISGRAELLAAALGIATLLLLLARSNRVVALAPVAMFLALCSKEHVVLLPVFAAYLLCVSPELRSSSRSWSVACCVGSVLAYVILRRVVLGEWTGPAPDVVDQPLVGASLLERVPTALALIGRYLGLFVWPARLSIDYSPPIVDVVTGLTPFLLLGSVAVLCIAALAVWRPSSPPGWGAAFVVLTFALASNVPVVIGTIFAERLLYLPSAGLIVIVCHFGVRLARRGRWASRVAMTLLVAVMVASSARTFVRNEDYRNGLTIAAATVEAYPSGWKMRGNLAHELERRHRYAEALVHAEASFRINPRERNIRLMQGRLLVALGRNEEAIEFLSMVHRADPDDSRALMALSKLLLSMGRHAAADSVIDVGHERFGGTAWTFQAARAAHRRDEWEKAARLYGEVETDVPEAPLFMAFCLLEKGEIDRAREAYAEALNREPDSAAAANGLAWCTLETGGSTAEAIRLAEQAVAHEASAYHYDTLARAYGKAGRCDEALDAAHRALELRPEDEAIRALVAETRACR